MVGYSESIPCFSNTTAEQKSPKKTSWDGPQNEMSRRFAVAPKGGERTNRPTISTHHTEVSDRTRGKMRWRQRRSRTHVPMDTSISRSKRSCIRRGATTRRRIGLATSRVMLRGNWSPAFMAGALRHGRPFATKRPEPSIGSHAATRFFSRWRGWTPKPRRSDRAHYQSLHSNR